MEVAETVGTAENAVIAERGGATCFACTIAFSTIKPMLSNLNYYLLEYLNGKCGGVKTNIDKQVCELVTGDKGKELVGFIVNIFEADVFCKLVRVCKDD